MSGVTALAADVFYALGKGHAECVYHRALETDLREHGIGYESEKIVPITYRNHVVGHSRLDLVVEDVVYELKAIKNITDKEITQVKNYLRLTGLKIGVVINFPTHSDRLEAVAVNLMDDEDVEVAEGRPEVAWSHTGYWPEFDKPEKLMAEIAELEKSEEAVDVTRVSEMKEELDELLEIADQEIWNN